MPEIQRLVQTLHQLPAALQHAQQPPRPALKLDAPTYNGSGEFREWRRMLEIVYDAKQLNEQENITWKLASSTLVFPEWPHTPTPATTPH